MSSRKDELSGWRGDQGSLRTLQLIRVLRESLLTASPPEGLLSEARITMSNSALIIFPDTSSPGT